LATDSEQPTLSSLTIRPRRLVAAAGMVVAVLAAALALNLAHASRTAAGPLSAPTPTPTTVPFLQPPFARIYRVTSYFDHLLPDHSWDDTLVLFNGDQASAIDGIMDRSATFRGGYWIPDTEWYAYYDGHNAYDYGTGAGTTILAAAPGQVVFAGSIPSSCATPLQYVCIEHANDYRTFYLHLEGVLVRKGEWVEAGDPLGISGNSGCSLGAHLHFSVQHNGYDTDPYGWRPTDRPDPLIALSGQAATWLWRPDQPLLPIGKLTEPAPDTKTNGNLNLDFAPDVDSPPVARVEFRAYYADQWHLLGVDDNGSDGWSLTWDTRAAPEGEVWLQPWAVGQDGQVGKGSPIRAGIIVDRQPPQGYIVGLLPGSAATTPLWLYAAAYDPDSGTRQVTFFVRADAQDEWREIGDATWLHVGNWLLTWDGALGGTGIADGSRFDIVARLTDNAGNVLWTEPVEGVLVDRRIPGGELTSPVSGSAFTAEQNLVFAPSALSALPIHHVEFHVWYDGDWHSVGQDQDGSDGWAMTWDPAEVADQPRLRVQARVYDAERHMNTALSQVTDLTLDRTPPKAGYVRPAAGGVARPDTAQQVWAQDAGSGVASVEFFADIGQGWQNIGEDREADNGWSLLWDAQQVPDGIVALKARVSDRAGNVTWTTDIPNIALDRTPPAGQFAFPRPEVRLSGVTTLSLDVADNLSGLDRAIFYARYEDRWHYLGADLDRRDGFSLTWDVAPLGDRQDVALTAWVYDRAGNHVELPHVTRLVIGGFGRAAATRTPTVIAPSPTATVPTPTDTPLPSPTPSATPTSAPVDTATPSPTLVPSPTETETAVPTPTATATLSPTAPPTQTLSPTLSATAALPAPQTRSLIPPVFWYLIGTGLVVATVLIVLALRSLNRTDK
jgi:murein DD-endopeptidase MepM/ murein hydrolase activator NlpD